MGFLCMRRDVSVAGGLASLGSAFSLHAQRCFLGGLLLLYDLFVFSACAEMFLQEEPTRHTTVCFLCMRRDVSKVDEDKKFDEEFSLLAQRCFP